jgi:dihydrofolate reductase
VIRVGTVVANMSMSLDGFIEDADGVVGELFTWYGAGDQVVEMPGDARQFRLSRSSADRLRDVVSSTGALVCGRRLFDLTQGWGGRHPAGVPVFVVTHRPPSDWAHPEAPFTFVTDGVASAVAQARAVAGDRSVAVASADVAQQCLDLGLLDAIAVDLVPVLLGGGTPFLTDLRTAPVRLSTPAVTEGHGVTHLVYDLRRSA